METTIDKAGRIVIPAFLRIKAGLRPGIGISVVLEDDGIRLMPHVPRPKLVCRNGRLVAVPTTAHGKLPSVDVGVLVDEERDRWPL